MTTEVLVHHHRQHESRSTLMARKNKTTSSKTTFPDSTPINQNYRQTDTQIPRKLSASPLQHGMSSQSVLLSSQVDGHHDNASSDSTIAKKRSIPSPRRIASSLSFKKSGLSRMLCDFGGNCRDPNDIEDNMTFLDVERVARERSRRKQKSESTREADDEWDSAHRSCWESFREQYTKDSFDDSGHGPASLARTDTEESSSGQSAPPSPNSSLDKIPRRDGEGSLHSRRSRAPSTTRRATTPLRKEASVSSLASNEAGRPPLSDVGGKSISFRGYSGVGRPRKTYRKNRLVWKYSSPEEDRHHEPHEEDPQQNTPETSSRSSSSLIDFSDDDLLKDNDLRYDDVSVDWVVSSRATSPARPRGRESPFPGQSNINNRPYTPPMQSITTTSLSPNGSTASMDSLDPPAAKQPRAIKKKHLRFADEIGNPIEEVKYVETEFSTEEVHSVRRIMILLLSPAHRRFELIHVSYQQQYQNRMTISQVVEQIAPMATDKKLRKQHYIGLTCRRKDPSTGKIHAEELLNTLCIQDYELVKNEVVVALVKGYKSKELMNMAEALLRNKKVLRAVKMGTANKQAVQKLESSKPTKESSAGTLTSPNANKKHKESFGERYPKRQVEEAKIGSPEDHGIATEGDGGPIQAEF